MFRKLLLVLVILLAGGYAAAEVAAKGFVESKIEQAVVERDPAARDVEATVSTPLVFGLLTKRSVEEIEVAASHVAVGAIAAERARAVLHGVEVDLRESIRQREAVVTSIDLLDVVVEISQVEASKVLPAGFRFEFGQGTVVLEGPAGVRVEGRLEVDPPARLRFEPRAGAALPRGVSVPRIEFADVPFVVCVREVAFEPGLMRVTCSQEDPPPRLPP